MTTWYAVLMVGAASYVFRLLPWVLLERVQIDNRVETGLRYAGVGAMAALLVGSLTEAHDASGSLLPLVAALGVAAVLTWRDRSALLVVVTGLATFLVLDLAW